ncbi:hypothetical protein HDU96_006354 [Phlyctochytrium bullatum]|nr:hypothetical protein HDU96_006354 [Phlyctochytrium bullatum]
MNPNPRPKPHPLSKRRDYVNLESDGQGAEDEFHGSEPLKRPLGWTLPNAVRLLPKQHWTSVGVPKDVEAGWIRSDEGLGTGGPWEGWRQKWAELKGMVKEAFNPTRVRKMRDVAKVTLASFYDTQHQTAPRTITSAIWLIGYLRAKYPRLNNAVLISTMIVVFELTDGSFDSIASFAHLGHILRPLLAGALVCLVVNLTFFPQTGSRDLRNLMDTTLLDIRELLSAIVSGFGNVGRNPDMVVLPKIGEAMKKVRGAVSKLRNLAWEAELELSYSRYSPKEYSLLLEPLENMMKHFGGMESVLRTAHELFAASREKAKEAQQAKSEKADPEKSPIPDITVVEESDAGVTFTTHAHIQPQDPVAPREMRRSMSAGSTPTPHPPLSPKAVRQIRSSAAMMDLIREGHLVEPSGREITDGAFGGNAAVLDRYILAQKDAFHLTAMASAECIGGVVRLLEMGEEMKNSVERSSLFDEGDFPELSGFHMNSSGHGMASHRGSLASLSTPTAAFKKGIVRTEDALADLDRALLVMERTQESYIRKLAEDKTASPWREELFIASFFEVSLREAAIEIKNLVDQAMRFEKTVAQRSLRFWLPSAPMKDLLRHTDSLGINSINPSAELVFTNHLNGKANLSIGTGYFNRVCLLLHEVNTWFSTHEVRYAFKLALSTIMFGWPAFLLPEEFVDMRGAWGLVTLVVVLAPTVGGSITFGVYRVLGTLVGAVFGFVAWSVAPTDSASIITWLTLFSVPCWYIYLNSGFARFGTTALMTMLIITLNAHQYGGTTDLDVIWSDTWKRLVIMLVSVTAAILLSSCWWPYVARLQLRLDLATTLNALGGFYSLLVVMLMDPDDAYFVPDPPKSEPQGPLESIIQQLVQHGGGRKADGGGGRQRKKLALHQAAALANVEAIELEGKVMDALASHRTLLELAASEPELRWRFPKEVYESVLGSVQVLLDRMMSVRHLIKNGLGDVHNKLIMPLAKYRRDMLASILLYIHVLNGSLAGQTPLPMIMPAARAMRLRVISRLPPLNLTNAKSEDIQAYSHFFAFCLMQQEIIEELEKLAGSARLLFGQSRLPYMKEIETE